MTRIKTDDWADRLGRLLIQCDSLETSPADLVSEIYDLLATGPGNICDALRPEFSRSTLRTWVDAGDCESAALGLLRRCGYMVSGNGHALYIATVVTPTSLSEFSYSSSSEAVAICGALALALQEMQTIDAQANRDQH